MRAVAKRCGSLGKASLLAGSALGLLFAVPVFAQTQTELPTREAGMAAPVLPRDLPKRGPPPPAPPPPDDALGQHGFYLEADTLVRDDKNKIWTAEGSVEGRYQGRVIRADKLVYNTGTGAVTADGHAQIINLDGTVQFANHVVLDDKMRAGFARGFSTLEQDNLTFTADVAIRRSEQVNELNRAVFTPCDICAANGSPKTPTWSIAASKVIEDHAKHVVYYRNAVIRIKDIPIFYAPVFWHPDPGSTRASGLLMPQPAVTSKRGASYQQTYYQVLSPSSDLQITPQINSKVNPFLNLDYRERFYSGQIDIRAGYTYEKDFTGDGALFGNLTSRSYILASGAFNLDKDWSWGFTADRTSDRYIFDKYDISNIYTNEGEFVEASRQLISQIYANRQDSGSYFSISALSFQGLSPTDENRTFPLVAPLVEYRFEPSQAILGGRLRLTGSGVLLDSSQSYINPLEPGIDSRRATVEANWMSTYTLGNGLRLQPFVDIGGDVYDVSDLSNTNTGNHVYDRSHGDVGLDLNWPLIQRTSNGLTTVLEPIAQLILAPDAKLNPNIPDEDSQVFTFDETNLFSADRFDGYDLYDGGARLNLAGRATFNWGDGESARILVGRAFRADNTNIYPVNTGLNGRASDWVLAGDAVPVAGLSLYGRALLDDRGSAESQEIGADFAYDNAQGYLRYATDNTQPTGRVANIEVGSDFFVTKNWGVGIAATRDLVEDAWRLSEFSVIYKDDCIRVEVVWERQETVLGQLGPSNAVFLRLKLATLDGQGYKDPDFR
jgi:LPS-assembly protein